MVIVHRNDVAGSPGPGALASSLPGTSQPEPAREAAAQFAGLLLESALRPLAETLGFYGDAVVASVARSLAERERGGLTDGLTRALLDAGR
jgi:hypothetical protein